MPIFKNVKQFILTKDGVNLPYGLSFLFDSDAKDYKKSWEQVKGIRVEVVAETNGAGFQGTFFHIYSNLFKTNNPAWDEWGMLYKLVKGAE
jgi:hypothetical protein